MSGQKNILITVGFVLSVSFITSFLAVMMVSHHYSRLQFDLLNGIFGEVLEQEPEAERIISAALKEYTSGNTDSIGKKDVLSILGYCRSDFSNLTDRQSIYFVTAGFLSGILFLSLPFCIGIKKKPCAFRP